MSDFSNLILNVTKRKTVYYTNSKGTLKYKQCSKCKEIKRISCYSQDKYKWDNFSPKCKACASEYSKKNTQKNKEKMKSYSKEYRIVNKKKVDEYHKDYRKKNKKWIAEKNKKYAKKWRLLNPEILTLNSNRRRTRVKGLPSNLTTNQQKKIYKDGCFLLPESKNLHLEHFIPVSWGVGGTTYDNCYLMDGLLNFSKGDKNAFEWIKKQEDSIKANFYEKLIPELSKRNGMTTEDFKEYIYKCEKNKISIG